MADPRLTRLHPYIRDRQEQLVLNHKAIEGGRPYIAARLSRHACESETSWQGTRTIGGNVQGIQGRKDRAFLVNYAGRIARKINQLVTSGDIKREGIDPAFERDASATGLSIGQFMDRVGEFLTAGGWAWIGIDRMAAPVDDQGQPRQRSQAEREASGDRVWWTAWRAYEVVDWRFGPGGNALEWLITEERKEEGGDDPNKAPVPMILRTIWTPGGGVRLYAKAETPDKVEREEQFTIGANVVPFVPVGVPTGCPCWFDDVEMVCASILNLESAHNENLVQSVFPQLIMPTGIIEWIMQQANASFDRAVTMARGLNYPIIEPAEAKGVTRYLQPSASDLEAIPNEITRRRADLFEIVGMALSRDSAQVESAEAKRIGLLDVSAVLAQRAEILQTAEGAAVAMSKRIDPAFAVYAPIYPTAFDVGDIKGELESLLLISTAALPDGAKRELAKAFVRKLVKVGKVDKVREAELLAEADADQVPDDLAAFSAAGRPADGAIQDTALNGAQVASLLEIAIQAASKGLPIETAKEIAQAAFPAIGPEEIAKIFAPLVNFKPAQQPAQGFAG